jgi:hypothetical protein
MPVSETIEGQVTIDLTIKETDQSHIYLHMQDLSVTKFKISFGEKLFGGISQFDDSFVDHTY